MFPIHNVLVGANDEFLRSALDYLKLQPDLKALIHEVHNFRCPNIGQARSDRILYQGLAFLLPSPINDRSLSLAIWLHSEHMKLVKKFFYDF
ncbi:hypothetical protein GIB67_012571 [Kingdonia uniflora]|uniref:Uncharacterized protein n=1 Tax=Kingdonia uniflora TaxID=39325 RepID=A0A7J7NF59_9MAGN|nr:hypothetical protein GIB67_012571 [Kingdonia uniflora]